MFIKIKLSSFAFLVLLMGAYGPAVAQEDGAGEEATSTVLQNRIDFGNSYIMGQSITSGSVYLLNRKKSDISSMLKVRSDFRDEITEEYSLEESKIISEETVVEKND